MFYYIVLLLIELELQLSDNENRRAREVLNKMYSCISVLHGYNVDHIPAIRYYSKERGRNVASHFYVDRVGVILLFS